MRTHRPQPSRPRRGAIYAPDRVVQAVAAFLAYCWEDEAHDYQARTPQARNGHVFRDLLVIRRWLRRNDVSEEN
ncbi:MAG: hypothetical protein NTY19_23650 [Planctomycetota bacterium]|nr:hypothetical protein [Planctomycetota bacterium]